MTNLTNLTQQATLIDRAVAEYDAARAAIRALPSSDRPAARHAAFLAYCAAIRAARGE